MSKFKSCHRCNARIDFKERDVGDEITCPKCGAQLATARPPQPSSVAQSPIAGPLSTLKQAATKINPTVAACGITAIMILGGIAFLVSDRVPTNVANSTTLSTSEDQAIARNDNALETESDITTNADDAQLAGADVETPIDPQPVDTKPSDANATNTVDVSADKQFYPWDESEQRLAYQASPAASVGDSVGFAPGKVNEDRAKKELERARQLTVVVSLTTRQGHKTLIGTIIHQDDQGTLVAMDGSVFDDPQYVRCRLACFYSSGTDKSVSSRAIRLGIDNETKLAVLKLQQPPPYEVSMSFGKTPPTAIGDELWVIPGPDEELWAKNTRFGPPIQMSSVTVSHDGSKPNGLLQISAKSSAKQSSVGSIAVSKQGEIRGIVVKAKSHPGEVILPIEKLRDILRADVSQASIGVIKKLVNGYAYRVRIFALDPLKELASVDFLTFSSKNQTVHSADKEGRWHQAAKKLDSSVTLQRYASRVYSGNFVTKATSDRVYMQTLCKFADGSQSYSPPSLLSDLATYELNEKEKTQFAEITFDDHDFEELKLPQAVSRIVSREDSGDFLALGLQTNEVFALSSDAIKDGDLSSSPALNLGAMPQMAVFKRHGDRNFWIVSCYRKETLHVVDADSFQLVKEIQLEQKSFTEQSSLSASRNPADPFVYYSDISNRFTGAIDLRQMDDLGRIEGASAIAYLFSDGQSAFGRSFAGLQLFHLANDFNDDKPLFKLASQVAPGELPAVVSSREQYVFLNQNVLSSDLGTFKAKLPAAACTVFQERPVIAIASGRKSRASQADSIEFLSTHDFKPLGASIKLPKSDWKPTGATSDQRRLLNADLPFSTDIHADEKNDRLLLAYADRLYVRSISQLGLPEEPLLSLEAGATVTFAAAVGRKTSIPLKTSESNVVVSLEAPLPGMAIVKNSLAWRPDDSHVGLISVPVRLRKRTAERLLNLRINVSQPSIRIPFELGGMKISEAGDYAVVWSRARVGRSGLPVRPEAPKQSSKLAIVPLRAGVKPRETEVPFEILDLVLNGRDAILRPRLGEARVEIYSLDSMQRSKTLLSQSRVLGISVEDDLLALHGKGTIDLYSAVDYASVKNVSYNLSQLDRFLPSQFRAPSVLMRDGLLEDGILTDATTNRVKLIVSPKTILGTNYSASLRANGSFLRKVAMPKANVSPRGREKTIPFIETDVIPKRGWQVALWTKRESKTSDLGGFKGHRELQMINITVLDAEGNTVGDFPIAQDFYDANMLSHGPFLGTAEDAVYVGHGFRIYRWNVSGETASAIRSTSPKGFHFVPKQTRFVVGSRGGVFQHQLDGGKAPYNFLLASPSEALSIDEATGSVSIDRDKLNEIAISTIRDIVRDEVTTDARLDRLKLRAANSAAEYRKMTGENLNGYPFAVAIFVKAVDANGAIAQIQYFVLADIPFSEIANGL